MLLGAISVAFGGTLVARISSGHGWFFGMLYRLARSLCLGAVPALCELQTVCTPLGTNASHLKFAARNVSLAFPKHSSLAELLFCIAFIHHGLELIPTATHG